MITINLEACTALHETAKKLKVVLPESWHQYLWVEAHNTYELDNGDITKSLNAYTFSELIIDVLPVLNPGFGSHTAEMLANDLYNGEMESVSLRVIEIIKDLK